MREILSEMRVDLYRMLKNFSENYEYLPEAIIDELTQNFFDSTLSMKLFTESRINALSEGPKASMDIIFLRELTDNKIILIQQGTTGIINQEGYVTYAAPAKKDDRLAGERGQGWKVVLPFISEVLSETIYEDGEYWQVKFEVKTDPVDIEKTKVLHTKWENKERYFKRQLNTQGTRIVFSGFPTPLFEEIQANAAKIIIERWFKTLDLNRNYTIRLKYDDEASEEEIILPKLPRPFHKNIEPILQEEIPILNVGVPKNLFISHTRAAMPRGLKEGIGIVVNGHVVEWYKPAESAFVSGSIFGFIECNFLKKHETSTHQRFRNHNDVMKVKRKIRGFCAQIVHQIQEFESQYFDVPSEDESSSFLQSINKSLAKIVPDLDQTPHSGDSTDYKYIEQVKGSLDDLSYGDNYLLEVLIHNPYNTRKKFFLKIIQINSLQKTEEIIYSKGISIEGKKIENFQCNASIPNLTSMCTSTQHIKIFLEKDSKTIDSREKRVKVNQYLQNIRCSNDNNRRGEQLWIYQYIKLPSIVDDSLLDLKVLIYFKGKNIHELIKKRELIIASANPEEYSFTYQIPSSAQRGRYHLRGQILSQQGEVVDSKSTNFFIERYIEKIHLPSKVNRGEKFKITITVINPSREALNGSLEIEIHSGLISRDTIEMSVQANPSETKIFNIEHEIPKSADMGSYLVKCSLYDSGTLLDFSSKRFIVEKKDQGGFISRITFSSNLKMSVPAIKHADGTIEVNTFHYLFRRLDQPEGLIRGQFIKDLMVIIYYALKESDSLPENLEWWDFEQLALDRGE